MGKKNRRKNNTNNSKGSGTTKTEDKLKECQPDPAGKCPELSTQGVKTSGGSPQKECINLKGEGHIQAVMNGLQHYGVDYRQHEQDAQEILLHSHSNCKVIIGDFYHEEIRVKDRF